METITSYLISEKLLGLTVGLIGLGSAIIGVLVLFFLPQYKAFAMTLLLLGTIEAGLFLSGYYFRSDKLVADKIELYKTNPDKYIAGQIIYSEKALNSFFLLKLLYATLLLAATVACSKLNLGSTWNGILYALIIHLALAITIDNFGEQYTKKYYEELSKTRN
jgi:hypothetical protein